MSPSRIPALFIVLAAAGACTSAPVPSPTGIDGGIAADTGVHPITDTAVDTTPPPAAPYTLTVFDNVRISSQSADPHFQKATADVDFHDGPFASVTMVVDLASTCYPFTHWAMDPPPMGQNWPADCDAFDRNFEFTLDEPATPTGPPAFEVLRAITPFGGPEHAEVDLTDLANGLPGHHTLQTYIATWSDGAGRVSGSNGGWNVTTHINVVPGPAPRRVLAVESVFNLNHGSTTVPMDYTVTTPPGTRSSRLEYRVTGHGGANVVDVNCIGPAEEFCHRTHDVTVDGTSVDPAPDPWRDDCQANCTLATSGAMQYCRQNPCGNISSVRAPRANWCPGTVTPPFTWTVDALNTPGNHTIRYAIDHVAAGGTWRMSATYYAFGGP